MLKKLAHVVLSAIAVFVAAKLLPGVRVDSFGTALVAAVVLGLVNAIVRPIVFILTLPINILTLGLFTFVIIGGCVLLVAKIVPGFYIASFWWALAFAGVLSLLNAFLHSLE